MDYQDPDQRLRSQTTKALGSAGRVWLAFMLAPSSPLVWYYYSALPAITLFIAAALIFPWIEPLADQNLEHDHWDTIGVSTGLLLLLALCIVWVVWG